MPPIPEIPLSEIRPLAGECVHPARSILQADLFALDWKGEPALLKDFSGRPWWVRRFWAGLVMGREFRALRRLQGVEGIPRLLASAGPHAIMLERLAADRLPRDGETPPEPEFFARFDRLLAELHRRGIGHGDLRRKNILIDADQRPYLIDFATAVTAKPGLAGAVSRFFFRHYEVVDLAKAARIKAELRPDLLTDEDRARIEGRPWYLRAGRFFKSRVYRMKKPRHRKALMDRLKRKLRGEADPE